MRKFVGIMVTMAILLSFSGFSSWAEGIAPQYIHIDRITASLSISGGVATCSGQAKPSSDAVTSHITLKLQQKDGNTWKAVASWSGSASKPGGSAVVTGTKTLIKGNAYRVVAYAIMKDADNNIVENGSYIGDEKTY